jgi:hypothetical protein
LINHHFNITVVSRHSSKATFEPSINIVKVSDSYPKEELLPIFEGQDAVVVSIRHAANELQIGMIDAAVDAGIKRFIPSDYGSVAENPEATALDPRKGVRKCCRISPVERVVWIDLDRCYYWLIL